MSEHRNIPGLMSKSGKGTVDDPYLGERTKSNVTYQLAWWWNDRKRKLGFNSKVLSASSDPAPAPPVTVPKSKSQARRPKTQNKPQGEADGEEN